MEENIDKEEENEIEFTIKEPLNENPIEIKIGTDISIEKIKAQALNINLLRTIGIL